MILILRAALFGAAQEAIVVYEGATTNHNVANHPGSNYNWGVYIDFSPDINAPPDDYEIIGSTVGDKIQIKWHNSGIYYLKVTETDLKGCENLKVLPVRVNSDDKNIGFMTSASSSCNFKNGNGFEIPVVLTGNNGSQLTSEYFPLVVEFALNNTGYSQLMTFENQTIRIDNDWLSDKYLLDTDIIVEITKATDNSGNSIQTSNQFLVHLRTVFAQPEAEFAEIPLEIDQGSTVDYQVKLISGQPVSAKYTWEVIPANGTSTDLSLIDTNAVSILWDGPPGIYTIQVSITDGNNCTTEIISKPFKVIEMVNNLPQLFAVPDFFTGYQGTTITGDLNANDFTIPEDDYKLIYSLVGESIEGLILQPDGTFIYNAPSGFTGKIEFTAKVCFEENTGVCENAGVYVFVKTHEVEVFAGNDTIIGNCKPYMLHGSLNGTEGFDYLWEPSELLDNPTIPNPVFTPGTTTTFKLTVTDIYGFSMSDNVLITVSDVIANAGEDIYMEQNSTVILDGTGSQGEELQFSWTTINGNINNGANTANPVISGFGNYYLEVTDAFGCVSTDSVNVSRMAFAPVANNDYDTTNYQTEVIIPVLDNDTDEENSIVHSSLTITKSPASGTAYVDFNNFTIHYRPNTGFSGEDNFEYRICNASNICDEATVFVLVTDYKFLVPNGFSPNGDGINDYFEILGIEFYEGNSINIFNRWGNKVYEAKNYGISTSPKFWDGKANTGFRFGNEELTTGTYYYILDLGNGEKPIGGSIYLDR